MQGQISAGGLIVGGMIGQRGAPGNGIVSITYKSSSGLEDTYEVLYTNGETDDIVVTNGAEGNGISSITKTSSVGLVDTYTILYTNGSSDTIEVHNGEKGDKGDTGATGATPNLTIGNVTKGADASATITGTTDNPVLNLVLPKGDKGDKGDTGNTGATGNGIYSVTKTGTADLVDTYTILYTNGDTTTFTITNGAKGDTGATGNGISTITKTGTAGLVDTYTITYTNGNTDTFEVTNGADGSVTDVQVEGTSVVSSGVANITGLATQQELDYYKTIYNVLPKVSGNGESITLDNTGESILKLDTRGQCKQNSTTGINLFDKLTGGTYSGITLTQNDDGSFILNGTSDASNFKQFAFENDIVIPSGSYSLYVEANKGISTNSLNISLYDTSNNQVCNKDYNNVSNLKDVINFSVNEETTIRGFRSWVGNGNSASNVIIKCMLVSGTYTTSTIPSYEPYTNGASPNPDYPQVIHTINGDNEVVVCGKNLLPINSFSPTGAGNILTSYPLELQAGQYTISCNLNITSTKNMTIRFDYEDGTNKTDDIYAGTTQQTFTLSKKAIAITWYVREAYTMTNVMLEVGNTKTDFEPYQSQTYPINLPVENILNATYNSLTFPTNNETAKIVGNINLVAGITYYISYDIETATTSNTRNTPKLIYNGNAYYENSNTNYNLTAGRKIWEFTPTDTGTYDLEYWCHTPNVEVTVDNFMISTIKTNVYYPYGTTPIELCKIGDYQDYFYKDSGKWFKYKVIEKIILNGSENWWQDRELTNTYRYYTATILPNSIQNLAYCDNFKSVSTYTINNTDGEALCRINEGQIAIRLNKTRANTLNDFKSWLSTHNTLVYYVLATPTTTEITDTTLISQLDNLEYAMSYEGQTNISQVNNDIPFKIYASALMKISGE